MNRIVAIMSRTLVAPVARSRWVAVLIVAALATGCGSSAYRALHPEDTIPDLAALKSKSLEQAVEVTRVATQINEASPTHIAIHETGRRHADRAIVMIHGVLGDHTVWRFVRGELGEEYRIIMLDLPGVGQSDKPSPKAIGPDGYSPHALAARVWQALDGYFRERDPPQQITLMGHSLGGAIVMFMLGSPEFDGRYSALRERIDSAVLLTPADIAVVNPPEDFMAIATASDLTFFLGELLGILRDRLAQGVARAVVSDDRRLREEADRMVAILSEAASRCATQAMLLEFVPRDDAGEIDWDRVEALTIAYGRINVPVLITWGARDETLPDAYAYKLATVIPDARMEIIPNCRHSVHLEKPREVIDLIRAFLATTMKPPMNADKRR